MKARHEERRQRRITGITCIEGLSRNKTMNPTEVEVSANAVPVIQTETLHYQTEEVQNNKANICTFSITRNVSVKTGRCDNEKQNKLEALELINRQNNVKLIEQKKKIFLFLMDNKTS